MSHSKRKGHMVTKKTPLYNKCPLAMVNFNCSVTIQFKLIFHLCLLPLTLPLPAKNQIDESRKWAYVSKILTSKSFSGMLCN